jgi:hypothetical protein
MIYMYTFNYYLFINVYCSVNKITFILKKKKKKKKNNNFLYKTENMTDKSYHVISGMLNLIFEIGFLVNMYIEKIYRK